MNSYENKTIADIITENINTAKVFEKYKIGFGFEDDQKLKSVCKKTNVDISEICNELSHTHPNNFYLRDYNSWDLDLLITFLIEVHHDKIKHDLKLLKIVDNLIKKEFSEDKLILKKCELTHILSNELTLKMKREEIIIFPYIKKLQAIIEKHINNDLTRPYLKQQLHILDIEREQVSIDLREILELTVEMQSTKIEEEKFNYLHSKLKQFYFDIQLHNHIEKNILLPKALKLEEILLSEITNKY